MAGPLQTTQLFGGAESFYNDAISTSARFSDDNNKYLQLTHSGTPTSTKIFTFSCWIKRWDLGEAPNIFGSDKGTSGGPGDAGWLAIDTDEKINVANITSASYNLRFITTSVFRDLTQWYNIVFRFDTTQSDAADRVRIYVNGTQQAGSYSTTPGLNADIAYNYANSKMRIAGLGYADGYEANIYLADVNHIDGTSYGPENFGETKNGIWIPKDTSGLSFGNNGYRLQFKNTGTGTASASTIGADTSGNTHHFTSNNMGADDSALPDCPENNFATLNSLIKPHDALTFSEGNLKISRGSGSLVYSFAGSTIAVKTGKWYAEWRPIGSQTAANHMVGISTVDNPDQSAGDPYLEAGQINYVANGTGHIDAGGNVSAGTFSSSSSYGDGDVVGIALDLDSGTRNVKFYKNGSLVNTTNLSSHFDNKHIYFYNVFYNTNTGMWNFGQDSTFAGNETAATNADGNGIGAFHESVPSGYLALCSANLPEPTIGPNSDTQADEYFGVAIWSGDNADSRNITDYQFQPDWAWIKCRNTSGNGFDHVVFDSQRGVSSSINTALSTSQTDNEGLGENVTTSAQLGGISAFLSNGFTLLEGSSSDDARYVNENSRTYVGWAWKAGGATGVSNTDGTITSTVSANTTAGFSIVLYAGSESNATVGHGLGGVPDLLIWKKRNGVNDWVVYHSANTSAPATDHLHLNNTNATNDQAVFFQDTLPTSTVFSIGTDDDVNDAKNYVVYCFRSIEGYSSFGEYTGNGSTDGAFVYCGFRPAFIITKKTSGTGNWYINDTTRATYNPTNTSAGNLYADLDNAEGGNGMDILSNGFKIRNTDSSQNASAATYVFLAFAENPQKYANAR